MKFPIRATLLPQKLLRPSTNARALGLIRRIGAPMVLAAATVGVVVKGAQQAIHYSAIDRAALAVRKLDCLIWNTAAQPFSKSQLPQVARNEVLLTRFEGMSEIEKFFQASYLDRALLSACWSIAIPTHRFADYLPPYPKTAYDHLDRLIEREICGPEVAAALLRCDGLVAELNRASDETQSQR